MVIVLRVAALLGSVTLALAPLPALPAIAAAAVEAPIDQYPQAPPQPLGNSRPPLYLDDDETVRAQLNPGGDVAALSDAVILRIRGSGDYAIFMPGTATLVANLGGDSPPGLQEGHVSFLGNLVGQGQLGADVTLEPQAARDLPLKVRFAYSVAGRPVDPAALGSQRGPVTVRIDVVNLTAAPHQFVRGSAAVANLAPILETLRQVPAVYTPETDMATLLPLPSTLPVPAAAQEQHDTYVPFAISLAVKLAAGETVVDGGAADVSADPRGARLTWLHRLPAAPDGAGSETVTFTYSGSHPRLPSIEVKADPLPLPASVFTPPGGGPWAAYLARTTDRVGPTLLAQEGAASLHRIQDLVAPLNRPGPGPQKVRYDLVLDSGGVAITPTRPSAPPRAEPWAVILLFALASFAAANAVAAWARH
jgi:hypothetical protein